MKMLRYIVLAGGLAAVVISVSYFTSLFAQQGAPEDPRPAAASPEQLQPVPEDSVEVQTSGPIHEAFALPLTTDVPESIVVDKRPAEPIEEVPPEQKAEGSNVVWIPGYFAWDDQRNDFIWISGFWRDVPPGRVWVSGYWTEVAGGSQWVPGFWTSAEQDEVDYLPPPPETVEAGPSIQQPSPNHFWVPGHWLWVGDHYVWRPDYWSRINPDWVWVPAHYVWCPSGYVFVDGYWDYPVVRRGLLFAPVYFEPLVYRRHHYYTPSIVWSTHLLLRHLFVRPAYYHYYFGDYYDDHYADWGIRPWYTSFTFGRVSYDPLFSYYRWRHRDRDWVREVRDRHDYYRRNRDFRPPRTYRDQQRIVSRSDDRERIRESVVAAPITQVVNRTAVDNVTANIIDANFRTPFRIDRVAQQERRQITRQADELRNVVRQRRQLETRENVAQVEGDRRDERRPGEDPRGRRAAPRGLDISNVAEAIGVTPQRRGARTLDRGDATARIRRGEDAAVRRAATEEQAKARGDETRPDRGRARPDIGVRPPEAAPLDRGTPRTRGPRLDLPIPGTPDVRRTPPGRERSPAADRGPEGDRPPAERRRGRPERAERAVAPMFSPEPADVTRLPRGFGREQGAPPTDERTRPSIERTRPSVDRRLPRSFGVPSGAARQPPEARAERRADPVTPLRLGGPRTAPRPAPVARPDVGSRRESAPSASRSADRPRVREPAPGAERSRPTEPRGEGQERSRGRGRD